MVIKDRNIFASIFGALSIITGLISFFASNSWENKPPIGAQIFSVVLGIFVISVSKTTTITFTLDKYTRRVVLKRKSLITEESREYNLDQITQLKLQQDYPSSPGRGNSYRLVFILNDGQEIPLSQTISSTIQVMGNIPVSNERLIGTRIANF